ncbi:MAG TPA: type II toxin-antitoxin system Phd/YefM family antitoxin [Thermomicrobiales bacterium]|nr:type II toxin-antitoxin system Phd/YefM family antitoxin [Thermomicrobiales bacterium]
MHSITASEARDEFADIINRVAFGRERVTIRRRGKELVAVIPIEDLRLLERLEEAAEDEIDLEEARKILADPTEERIPWEEVKRDLGLPPA